MKKCVELGKNKCNAVKESSCSVGLNGGCQTYTTILVTGLSEDQSWPNTPPNFSGWTTWMIDGCSNQTVTIEPNNNFVTYYEDSNESCTWHQYTGRKFSSVDSVDQPRNNQNHATVMEFCVKLGSNKCNAVQSHSVGCWRCPTTYKAIIISDEADSVPSLGQEIKRIIKKMRRRSFSSEMYLNLIRIT